MPSTRLRVVADRRATEISREIGRELQQLREDAGIRQAAVAERAGVSQPMLSRLEAGEVRPSIGTLSALAEALGADLSIRLFPSTGVPIRDRFQARMIEALIRILHPRWQAHPEVAVLRPSRGFVDLVLEDARLPIAAEAQFDLRRLEAQVRRYTEKAGGLPFTNLAGGRDVTVSRLLLLRCTRRTRELAREFAATLAAAYPARTRDTLAP